MAERDNYYIIQTGVKRTLELAKFLESEVKLTTTAWFYNLEENDKSKLTDMSVKSAFIADDLVRSIQRYYDAISNMIWNLPKRRLQEDIYLYANRGDAKRSSEEKHVANE